MSQPKSEIRKRSEKLKFIFFADISERRLMKRAIIAIMKNTLMVAGTPKLTITSISTVVSD